MSKPTDDDGKGQVCVKKCHTCGDRFVSRIWDFEECPCGATANVLIEILSFDGCVVVKNERVL